MYKRILVSVDGSATSGKGLDEAAKLGDAVLLPGMPVEAFIQTGARTPMSYLLKPLTDYFTLAFREE